MCLSYLVNVDGDDDRETDDDFMKLTECIFQEYIVHFKIKCKQSDIKYIEWQRGFLNNIEKTTLTKLTLKLTIIRNSSCTFYCSFVKKAYLTRSSHILIKKKLV